MPNLPQKRKQKESKKKSIFGRAGWSLWRAEAFSFLL
jgi:hypothetical protein